MRAAIRFLFLITVKIVSRLLYRFDVKGIDGSTDLFFRGSKIGILLNHTSLFEPLFIGVLPFSLLWRIARYGVFPLADITMQRPIAGLFFRLMAQDSISITRKRDSTWDDFIGRIHDRSVVLIAAEGRMKRRNGLDKEGRPMTVRNGVLDVLRKLDHGKGTLVYSGGLHHIHAPGDRFPRFFKTIRVRFASFDIAEFLKAYASDEPREARRRVARELERLRDENCPI